MDGQDEPRHLFAGVLPAQAIRQVGARRLGIIPDMRLWRLPFPDPHLSARTVGHLLDLKTIHDGTQWYQRAQARRDRGAAVAARGRTVHTEYERLARNLDERHHNVLAADVRAGRIAPGPVLSLLRTFPRVIGLAFGAFGEASPDVHTLLAHAATVGAARMWRTMGARSMLEARGFLVSQLRRTWGVAAVRAAARLRASRAVFIGMEPRVAQGLRRVAHRGPVDPAVFMAGVAPAVDHRRGLAPVGPLGALGARCFCCAVPAAVPAAVSAETSL